MRPDDGSVETWTTECRGDKLRADFADLEPQYVLPLLRRLIIFFRCSETSFVRHTDVRVGSHGPQAVTHLGPSKGAHGALGRCVPPYAGTYSLITVNKPPSSDLMIHLSSLSVPEEPWIAGRRLESRDDPRRPKAALVIFTSHHPFKSVPRLYPPHTSHFLSPLPQWTVRENPQS